MKRRGGGLDAIELDRLRELTSIGAGHAAGAFARLAGRTIRMDVPRVRDVDDDSGEWTSGVLFDVEGSLAGVMAILFHRGSRRDVARRLLGPNPDADQEDSALAEVGNILVSHIVSAIADTLGARILPSTPELHTAGAEVRLAERVRKAGAAGIRIESLLRADGGGLETLVVFAPRRGKRRARRRRGRSDTVRA
jgi:chemotaxis protein CheC